MAKRAPKRRKRAPRPARAVPHTTASAQAQRRAIKAVALMREGHSRAEAARRANTPPRPIQKYARPAIRRRAGTYAARPTDQLPRRMRVLSPQGVVGVEIRSSRTASELATYWAAVERYLRTGDRSQVRAFHGRALRAGGTRYPYVTDLDLLDQLAEVGEVHFEDLYEITA